jgi:signal transduction histidine kinase
MAREEERKRIAAELHDNIGTQLGFISRKIDVFNSKFGNSSPESRPMLEEIATVSQRTIGDLRETIWALRKEQVDFRDLADRLKLFLRRQFEDLVNVKTEINEEIQSTVILSPVESLNVFRIVQEALHNSAVHASASIVSLSFKALSERSWSIMIEDNGMGFNQDRTYENHFGIGNMKERAKESGLELNIQSEMGNGTKIILEKKVI